MAVVENTQRMQDICMQERSAGEVLAFVPTMGALHEGHLALVEKAKILGSKVIVSIFVNPTQFGLNEDYDKYPKQFHEDLCKLEPFDVFSIFHPTVAAIYPDGFGTTVSGGVEAEGLCAASRPEHFNGVLTVVLKLLNIIQPNFLVMGKKDYQQVKVIERMLRDFNSPVELCSVETYRDSNGLAMSSRNSYLTDEEIVLAAKIYQALCRVRSNQEAGVNDVGTLKQGFSSDISDLEGAAIEYVEMRTQKNFQDVSDCVCEPSVCLAAIRYKGIRLIDNIEFG